MMHDKLREMLERLPTEQLDAMLRSELESRPVDPAAVKLIMRVLEERDENIPFEMNDNIRNAWASYRNDIGKKVRCVNSRRMGLLLRVASVMLVLLMLFLAVPQKADATNLWDRIVSITDSILEFLSPGDRNDHQVEYRFETDNPGLQQVYDAVVEMGVTEPVVPMWLPDGYELVNLEHKETDRKNQVYAIFYNADKRLTFRVDVFKSETCHSYYKGSATPVSIEQNGVMHNVVNNHITSVVIWSHSNVECSLSIECQEETLYKIIDSIYNTMEGN